VVTVRLEGLGKVKNPMMSLGIEPTTFQFVAQCLNRYRMLQTLTVAVNKPLGFGCQKEMSFFLQ
jgi:glucose-6-phosphate 1-dehydrogenase